MKLPLKALLLCLSFLLLAGCEEEPAKLNFTGGAEPTLPGFSFTDISGQMRNSEEWKGQVLVVNYWATWCPPCREEMPLFIKFQEQHQQNGVQFVGIAIDDPNLVQDFVDVYGVNFPILLGGAEAITLSKRMGNRFESLPFTAIFDRQGNSRYIQAGEMTQEILKQELKPLL